MSTSISIEGKKTTTHCRQRLVTFLQVPKGYSSSFRVVVFSPDGQLLASSYCAISSNIGDAMKLQKMIQK